MRLSEELEKRGFIHHISSGALPEIVDGEQRTIYHGIDPSADSAHVGNLAIWMLLLHLARHGHKIVFLVGGGTGMIGDPKSDAERPLSDPNSVANNVERLKHQAEGFFAGHELTFVDNAEWLSELRLIDFLRDVGKHFTVNDLIKKEAIANRLQSDTGLSYTEFAYPLLQGYDYYKLFKEYGCTLQVGGSDQWGNIIAGVELVRRKAQTEVFAVTVPLVVDKGTGKKFGKSEGNAVWLSAEKTSPYEFYQFWFNISDENVVDYLKLFTFNPLDEIESTEQQLAADPGRREAQKQLAFSVTELVHGTASATAAQNVSELLFGNNSLSDLTEAERKVLLENAPVQEVQSETSLLEALLAAGLAASKREARTFIESGAVVVNDQRVTDVAYVLTDADTISDLILLKRGKKHLCVLKV